MIPVNANSAILNRSALPYGGSPVFSSRKASRPATTEEKIEAAIEKAAKRIIKSFHKNAPPEPRLNPIQKDIFSARPTTTLGLDRFAVIGDAGMGVDSTTQKDIARQMLKTYEKTPFASVLVLGDNVYEYGEPVRFKECIAKPYKKLLDKGVRFYPILGNHDVRRGHGRKQMAYWGAPKRSYYKLTQGPIDFFAVDTTIMAPGLEDCHMKTRDRLRARKRSQKQIEWLKTALQESQARFKIVYGHYPLYSSVDKRRELSIIVREHLGPVITDKALDVDAYLTGHDHFYERSILPGGIQHIISGAAGRLAPLPEEKAPYAVSRMEKNHFMLFTLENEHHLSFKTLSDTGELLDAGAIDKTPRFSSGKRLSHIA